MAASINDLLTQATVNSRPVPTTVTSPRAGSATTLNVNALTGWSTGTAVHGITYKVTTAGAKIAGTQLDFKAISNGTNQLTSFTVKAGSDTGNAVGDIVECAPTAAFANDLYSWGSSHANQDGSLKTTAVQTALNLGNTPSAGWTPLGTVLSYGANNGNKEFTVTAPIDLTSTVSPGMKLQVTRNTVPPTQCMAFSSASSQYATKASPSGITFTSAFTCEAWVYPTSYTGQAAGVIGRSDDITTGWMFELNASGQVRAYYASSSNFTDFISYQSVPLNQFTHIAVSVSSVSSKTASIYINGVLVPSFSALTAATALSQGTNNLSVGGMGAGIASRFFNGYISEARVWSAAQTQTQIQNNMAINLVGNETNLVALFQGNGNFNDATSNANNLTATGGAIATQANNPYNAVEYAVVTKVAYSNPNTTLTLFAGNSNTIPNQTLNSPQYSTARAPFGFPAGRDNWWVQYSLRTRYSIAGASGTWYNLSGAQLSIPTGAWDVSYSAAGVVVSSGAGFAAQLMTLSTLNTTETDPELTGIGGSINVSTTENDSFISRQKFLSLSAQTPYYLNTQATNGGSVTVYLGSTTTPASTIRAVCAYI